MPTPDERGASATEYALLATALAAVVVAVVILVGQQIARMYDRPCERGTRPAAGACE